MVRVSFVRFSNFATGRGKSATAEALAAGGFFSDIGQAGRSVDEARLLTERMFYLFKRAPTLMHWELDATKDELLATPEVGTYLKNVDRLTTQAEQLPDHVARERRAIVDALNTSAKSFDATLKGVREALADADRVATSAGRAGDSLNAMLTS